MKLKSKIKSFSLIEIIFTILLIVIISSVALPKFFDYLLKSSIIKLKTDVIIIQNAIIQYNSKFILINQTSDLQNLEESDTTLFSTILSTNTSKEWSKVSTNTYNYKINDNNNLVFSFDKNKYSFTCDKTIELCQKVLR